MLTNAPRSPEPDWKVQSLSLNWPKSTDFQTLIDFETARYSETCVISGHSRTWTCYYAIDIPRPQRRVINALSDEAGISRQTERGANRIDLAGVAIELHPPQGGLALGGR
jgi:hypothetical protein